MDDTNSPTQFDLLETKNKERLLNWCRKHLEPIKTINRKYSSYGLKHLFENSDEGISYITNGAFKGAMEVLGFKHTQGVNWYFNISQKSINKLRRETR